MRDSIHSNARIVVTGMGACTPIGVGVEGFWNAALAGTNGLREVTGFDHSALRTHVGGQVQAFDATQYVAKEALQGTGRAAQLALAAASMALQQAQLHTDALNRYAPERRAVSIGTTMGEPDLLDALVNQIVTEGYAAKPMTQLFTMPSFRIANHVARVFKFNGANALLPTACTAGNSGIGFGADLLRNNRADIVIAGGSDAFSRMAHVGFNKLLAVTPDRVRPFDLNRSGMAESEGSGILILERMEDAQQRGAPILAEFIDYGLGCDAHKMTIPSPVGLGGTQAFAQVLQRSQIAPHEIDYISAHGTGTRENDKVETQIIKNVLGDHAYNVKVSSIKSMIGHTMGAASALEAIICVQTLREGRIPPTINYETPDPECDLDCVPNTAIEAPVRVAASNAYAFGGNCSTVIFKRFEA